MTLKDKITRELLDKGLMQSADELIDTGIGVIIDAFEKEIEDSIDKLRTEWYGRLGK